MSVLLDLVDTVALTFIVKTIQVLYFFVDLILVYAEDIVLLVVALHFKDYNTIIRVIQRPHLQVDGRSKS